MDTINTVITNWTTLSNTPIDWSLDGGVVWLLMMVAGTAVTVGPSSPSRSAGGSSSRMGSTSPSDESVQPLGRHGILDS